jgi:hypothetical protein
MNIFFNFKILYPFLISYFYKFYKIYLLIYKNTIIFLLIRIQNLFNINNI